MNDQEAARAALMARIRSKDTKPELVVRRALHSMGYRFRLHRKDLPGRPDLVLPRHRLVIFVHGCFWHQHESCRLASKPKTRQDYWKPKLERNIHRDNVAIGKLEKDGWKVAVIWECATRDSGALERELQRIAKLAAYEPQDENLTSQLTT